MEKRFIKVSEIRRRASQKAMLHHNASGSKKIVKQLVGMNVLEKEWIDDARHKYSIAIKKTDLSRFDYLVQALESIYFCVWILQRNSVTNEEVSKLVLKIETSYYNNCHTYIEQNIHSVSNIVNCFNDCSAAIEVLAENNPSMANKYRQMLNKFKALNSSYIKIADYCSPTNQKFNNIQATQIAALISHHDSALKMYPTLREHIIEVITKKIDEIFTSTENDLEQILASPQPLLQKVIALLQDFISVHKPLASILKKQRYDTLIERLPAYATIMNIITNEYPEWQKTYQYYTLPRNQIDEEKVVKITNAITKYTPQLQQNFIELQALSPTITEIQTLLMSLLKKQSHDFILDYLKKENAIIKLTDLEEKIGEIVRFIHHINAKLADKTTLAQFHSELLRIQTDFMHYFDECLASKIKQFIIAKPNQNASTQFFNKIAATLYELNDLSKINLWLNTIKLLNRAMFELPEDIIKLQGDYEYLQSLPESEARAVLHSKLIEDIKRINETIPIMALYQMPDVEKIINICQSIEKRVTIKVNPTVDSHRLLVLDKFTNKNIIVYKKDILQIGRDEQTNDIILKSDWVSGTHCQLDFANQKLTDLSSTNGTTINGDKEKVSEIGLERVHSFVVAGIFEAHLEKYSGFFRIQIVKVHDPQLIKEENDYIKSLFNTEFIWLGKFAALVVDTLTGNVRLSEDSNNSEIVITQDGHFSVIDKENQQSAVYIKPNEEISTERYTICLA